MRKLSWTILMLTTVLIGISCGNESMEEELTVPIEQSSPLPIGGGGGECPPPVGSSFNIEIVGTWTEGSPYGHTCAGAELTINALGGTGEITWTIMGATILGYLGSNNESVIVELPSSPNAQLSFKATGPCGRTDTILGYTDNSYCDYCDQHPNSSICDGSSIGGERQ